MGVLCMRSKPYGDPSMGLRWPRSERYDAQGPPWLYPQKVQSRAVTLLGERPTGQKRTQRAASLILGQPPRRHHRWEAIGQGTPATCIPLLAGAWDDGLEARKDKATPLFPTRTGRRLSRREATAIIQRIAAQANGRLSAEEQSDVSTQVIRNT